MYILRTGTAGSSAGNPARGTWSNYNTNRQTEISITSEIYHQVPSLILIGTSIINVTWR